MNALKRLSQAKLLLFALCLLVACKSPVLHGHYSSNPKGKISFAGNALRINPDGTFLLQSWTDSYTVSLDQNGNQICNELKYKGQGTYTSTGDSLHLFFTNQAFVSINLEIRNVLVDSILTKSLSIQTIDELGKPIPIPVMILNHEKEFLDYKNFNADGSSSFQLDSYLDPSFVKLEFFGSTDLIVDITKLKEGKYTFIKDRCFGYFEKDDYIKVRYQLKRNRVQIEINDRLLQLKRVKTKS